MMSSSSSDIPSTGSIDKKSVAVTVIGGSGFVGSRVCKGLAEKGMAVTSVSKSGVIPEWCVDEDWVKTVTWNSVDLLSTEEQLLDDAIGKPEVVISCVGVIGTDPEVLKDGNGKANVNAFESAKRGGNVKRTAFVSVSSEVKDCQESWLPDFFAGYFEGKDMAEKACLDAVDSNTNKCLIVKPTFIYGGDSFGLLPPRVTSEYGSGIEQLLSFLPFQILADLTPGLIKVALRPPVSVEAVANACVALGEGTKEGASGVLEGTDLINQIADQPDATGLTDFLKWVGENSV